MDRAIYEEGFLLLGSLAAGMGYMAGYDLLRIFRMIFPHRNWAVGAEDLFYSAACTCVTFGLLCRWNDGELRGYIIAGVAVGMALFQNLVGTRILKCLQNGISWLKMKLKEYCEKQDG